MGEGRCKSVAILGEMLMCKCKLFAVRFQCHMIVMSFYLSLHLFICSICIL